MRQGNSNCVKDGELVYPKSVVKIDVEHSENIRWIYVDKDQQLSHVASINFLIFITGTN
jgi:hypothetical protein